MTRVFLHDSKLLPVGLSVAVATALAVAPVVLSAGPANAQAAGGSALAFLGLLEQAEARSAARDWAGAMPLWQQVVRANPTEGRYWSRLGMAYLALRDYRAAIPPL